MEKQPFQMSTISLNVLNGESLLLSFSLTCGFKPDESVPVGLSIYGISRSKALT